MKSKTSYFNRTLFFNLLRRYWPIFAGYLITWLIVLPVALGNSVSLAITQNTFTDIRYLIADAAQQVLNDGIYGGVIMTGIFGLLIAMAAFSYLYSSRSVSMICSLPIKREGVFLSVFTSGLLWMLLSNVIVFLVTMGVESAYGVLETSYLLQWLAMVCMMNLFFFGFAALCASFTGHLAVLPTVYIVLNFTAYVVESIAKSVMSTFIYGASSNASSVFSSLSPAVNIIGKTKIDGVLETVADGSAYAIGYNYNGWLILAIYAAVGIVFTALAMIIIKHRRMETAGDVVAVRPLKPIFKYCLTFGCALVLGAGIYLSVFHGNSVNGIQSSLYILLFMLFGGFIGYFAAEMLIQKTLHVFAGRKWIGFGVTVLILAAIVFSGKYDVLGYERRLPDINDVKGVSISCNGDNVLLEKAGNIQSAMSLHSDIISHKEANEQCYGDYKLNSYNVKLVYTLTNGKTLERAYNVYYPATNDILTLTDLMNVKEAVDNRKEVKIPVNHNTMSDTFLSYFDKVSASYQNVQLTEAQAYELYTQCIVPDFDDGTMGKVWFVTDDNYYKTVYDCTVNITFSQRVKAKQYNNDYFTTTLTASGKRTTEWVKEHFALDICTMGESRDIMNSQNQKENVAYAKAVSVG